MNSAKKNKKVLPAKITIFELLAVNCPKQSTLLLDKYQKARAKDTADLETKLVELYRSQPDKKEIEKEFASIHPHKEWIIDYMKPANPPEEIKVEEVAPTKETKVVDDGYYQANGCNCPSCRAQRHSYACGCGGHSSFMGSNNNNTPQRMERDNTIGILALVGVAFLAGYVLHNYKVVKA